MINKILKKVLFILLFATILLLPPFFKLFYQWYSENLISVFPIEVSLENDSYYFTIVTALTNTLIIGSLSYEINNFNKKAKSYEQFIEYSQYYYDIINSVKAIAIYHKMSISFEPILLARKIHILIKTTNKKIDNKDKLLKLITEINKIQCLKEDNSQAITKIAGSFVSEFCDELNLISELDNDLKIIFNINGKE